ncbi:MAG: hypothetical protein WD030_02020 [Pirellulales bacterium]
MSDALFEMQDLLFGIQDGDAAPETWQRLESLLSGDSNARAEYIRLMGLQVDLRLQQEVRRFDLPATVDDRPDFSAPSRRQRWWSRGVELVNRNSTVSMITSGLFMTIILLLLAMWVVPDGRQAAPADAVPSIEFVAHITETSGAAFDNTSDGNLKDRSLFADDKIVLTAGLVEVTFESGAVLLLEGPAHLQVNSPMTASLEHGTLSARVTKQAIGFAVNGPGIQVVDLGTEFGMAIDPQGGGELAVFDGLVSADIGGVRQQQTFRLAAGESLLWGSGGSDVEKSKLAESPRFTRRIPQRIAFPLISTGQHVDANGHDSQWRVSYADIDDEPALRVIAVPVYAAWLGDSHWISLSSSDWRTADPQEIFRFSAEFDLPDVEPASVIARGKIAADNRVVAVWLNGERLNFAQQSLEGFYKLEEFSIAGGFQAEGNTIVIEVENTANFPNPLALRFEATAVGIKVESDN